MYLTAGTVLILSILNSYVSKSVNEQYAMLSTYLHEIVTDSVTRTNLNNTEQSRTVDNLTTNDILISVRTTKQLEYSRLPLILKTWFQFAKEDIWFFTDGLPSPMHQLQANGHIVLTNCSPSHHINDLCCKTNAAYDHYIKSGRKWWCRFDDDNYVNIPRLVTFLQQYDHMKDWYLGRYPRFDIIRAPGEKLTKYNIYYATGGAGYCISKGLAQKMLPIVFGGKFQISCVDVYLPEDMTMGYLLESKLNVTLTFRPEFHSHIEQLQLLKPSTFKDQISFGFSKEFSKWTVVKLPGFYGKYDPTRLLSLHCFLFPQVKFCQNMPLV